MSLLKSLFGKKKDDSCNTNVKPTEPIAETEPIAPNATVDVQSLILLSVADSLVVGNNKPSDYMRDRLGIGFPNEKMKKLAAAGYARPSTAIEALSHLKATELKNIATQFSLKGSGKKEELCSRIAESVFYVLLNRVPRMSGVVFYVKQVDKLCFPVFCVNAKRNITNHDERVRAAIRVRQPVASLLADSVVYCDRNDLPAGNRVSPPSAILSRPFAAFRRQCVSF